MGSTLSVTCCFSLAAFSILPLRLIVVSLISMCLGVFLLIFILYGILCFLELIDYFLFHVGTFSTVISSKIFSYPFFFSSSGIPIIQMLVLLILSHRSLRLSSVLFIFLLYSALQKLFPPFCLPAH